MTILKFLLSLAIMQISHVFIVVALDGNWETRRSYPIACAVILDAALLFALIGA